MMADNAISAYRAGGVIVYSPSLLKTEIAGGKRGTAEKLAEMPDGMVARGTARCAAVTSGGQLAVAEVNPATRQIVLRHMEDTPAQTGAYFTLVAPA